jgi:hypothetical protein
MAAVVLAASLIWCLTLNAQVAAKGSVLAASAMARPDGPNAHANVAPLTQAQHQQLYDNLLALRHNLARQVPAAAAGPGTALSGASAPAGGITAAADASSAALPAPSALYIPLNKAYPVVGDGRSFTAEPSISNTGAKWFGTMNWNRAYSNNNGGAWTAIPDDSGPADAPFFCCDQDVIHDKGRDTTFWSNLYTNSNLTNGAIRIFVRNKANTGDLCSYTFDAGNVLFDYPHLGIGNDFLYLTTNNINSNGTWGGAEIWRFPLNQMSQCQGFGYNFFTWTGSVGQRVWVPARGLTDTLFLVTLENTTQNRIFSWPENSNTISWNLVNVWSSNFGAANCTYNGVNWMADTLSTSILGFQVRSVLGQDNQTSYLSTYYTVAAGGAFNHPQAYAAGNTIRIPDLALLNNADLWFTSVCTGFPDAAANARGDIGIALTVGSSSSGSGGPAVGNIGISDAFSRSTFRGWTGTWSAVASADANSSRYGDYTTMRMQDPADVGFIGATYGILLGSPNVRMVEFLRGRYAQGWQHRH